MSWCSADEPFSIISATVFQSRCSRSCMISLSSSLPSTKCTYLRNLACFVYGCETWSLMLKNEHRLRVYENRMLRRIWAYEGWVNKILEKTAYWWALWSVLFTLYCSDDHIKKMRWAEHVVRMLDRKCEHCFGEKNWGKRPLGRTRRRWVDSFKTDLQLWVGEAWTGLFWLGIMIDSWWWWMRKWTFFFHKILGISWLFEDLIAFQEGLRSVESVQKMCLVSAGTGKNRHPNESLFIPNKKIYKILSWDIWISVGAANRKPPVVFW